MTKDQRDMGLERPESQRTCFKLFYESFVCLFFEQLQREKERGRITPNYTTQKKAGQLKKPPKTIGTEQPKPKDYWE